MRGVSTARGWLVACAALALGAWASGTMAEGALPSSTANLYPYELNSSPVKGSKGRAVAATAELSVTFEDLIAATHKVASQKGLEIDHEDTDNGKLSGKGYWQGTCGGKPCKLPVTFAAYLEPAGCDGTDWRVSFVLDRYGVQAWDGGDDGIAQDFIRDFQKVVLQR